METAGNSKSSVSGDGGEEELEHFDDFTIASTWERFISEIEAVCRMWLAAGPKNLLVKGADKIDPFNGLHMAKSEFKYNTKSYCMEYYFETGKVADWTQTIHDLQLAFGVKEFLVIAPQSASGVILDAPEASKLLSAVAIALSNCSCRWPAFVPVHDPSRKAFMGIQNMGTVCTRRFEADRISSQVPVKLMHLEGLYELFISKFVYASTDLSLYNFGVQFKMKLTYRTATHDDEDDTGVIENGENDSFVDANGKMQWDADCQWNEWYSAEDPVQGYELTAVWNGQAAESSLYMAELENASPLEADQWFLCPMIFPNDNVSDGKNIGFASNLRLLVDAFKLSLDARVMEDFVSGSENVGSSGSIPPPTVLDRVIKKLFYEGTETPLNISISEHKNSLAIKGAPVGSLFAQFCLHALWFGNCNIHAIAVLWIDFVREVRWCWEESQPLPRVPANGTIDLSTCLINQKLHMLAICIDRKHHQAGGLGDDKNFSSETHAAIATSNQAAEEFVIDTDRKGSLGVAGCMMLLKSCKNMHAPVTQDPPPMTEDMHEERLEAVAALGNSVKFSAQLEMDVLVSDMSSFKAANPDAVFEDFIRWYSPKDWEDDDDDMAIDISGDDSTASSKMDWPPHGRLSERMSDTGNSWRKIWNEAPPLPVSEQKPLLDPNREGEKVLHYLETLPPHQLLGQMVCTAFRATADTLNRTSFGNLKLMNEKMGQLYATMASMLKNIHSLSVGSDSDVFKDLGRLCISFGHIEKLTWLAVSLNHKFIRTPRLAESFFNDYYNYYLPQMGTSSTSELVPKEFNKKQQIFRQERIMIADLFTPPTPSQSWRNVLSMGNMLNGNEPILREMIFSKSDRISESYYASCDDDDASQQGVLETYRMYVCGTSNDLIVALAVTSCD